MKCLGVGFYWCVDLTEEWQWFFTFFAAPQVAHWRKVLQVQPSRFAAEFGGEKPGKMFTKFWQTGGTMYIHIDVKIYWKSSRVLCIRWIHTAGISISGSEKKLELSRISQWKIRTSPSIKFQTHQKTSKSYLDWSIHGSQGSRNPKSSGHSLSV